jgi:DNA integrity scanning protein DisA with diadenylate cyclase activity
MTAKKKKKAKGKAKPKPKAKADPKARGEPPPKSGPSETTALFLELALEAANKQTLRAILLYADVFPTRESLVEFMDRKGDIDVLLVSRREETFAECEERGGTLLRVPDVRLTRMGQVKIAVLIGFSQNLLRIGDVLLCLSGVAESGVLDTLFVLEVGTEFELFAMEAGEDLPDFNPDVFERVLTLATSLAHEGREGRPVGTTFVLGDMEELLPLTEQMIFNPFKGYPESDRNVLDPTMEETIREFSALDGAFLIRRDGVVESAGTFLKSAILGDQLPRGLGARHQSAAAITTSTRALAVTISESTGTVTVFRGGKILMEVERPGTPAPVRPRGGDAAFSPGKGDNKP